MSNLARPSSDVVSSGQGLRMAEDDGADNGVFTVR
jgi:hypothetical protein